MAAIILLCLNLYIDFIKIIKYNKKYNIKKEGIVMAVLRSLEKKYRFEIVDKFLIFETRYYAQRFIDEYISQWYPPHHFAIEKREDGFYIYCKVELQLDYYDEPMIRY